MAGVSRRSLILVGLDLAAAGNNVNVVGYGHLTLKSMYRSSDTTRRIATAVCLTPVSHRVVETAYIAHPEIVVVEQEELAGIILPFKWKVSRHVISVRQYSVESRWHGHQ